MPGSVDPRVNNIYDCVPLEMKREMILAVNKRLHILMLEEWFNDWEKKMDDYGELWSMMQEHPKLNKSDSVK